MSDCTQCGAEVALPETVQTGQIVDCTTCGAELEVLEVAPVALAMAPELAQDWGE